MSAPRHYCWRVGAAIDAGAFGVADECPECSLPRSTHPLVRAGECGDYVPCPGTMHGHGCDLPVGHADEHRPAPCGVCPRTP